MDIRYLYANYSSLFLIYIKDFRVENNVHQGFFASSARKTPSSWSKIENGQVVLTFDTVYSICSGMNLQPSYVISILDKIRFELNTRGIYFYSGEIDPEDDILLHRSLEFYNSDGFRHLILRNDFNSISKFFNSFGAAAATYPDVLRYCLDNEFYAWINYGAPGTKPYNSLFSHIEH